MIKAHVIEVAKQSELETRVNFADGHSYVIANGASPLAKGKNR